MLDIRPALGRNFLTEGRVAGREHAAIVSEGFWRRRFGRSAAARRIGYAGRHAVHGGRSHAGGLQFPSAYDFYVERTAEGLADVERLKRDVMIEQARPEAPRLATRLKKT
ncbi:MAG TPA: hypothetical protein VNH83_16995 [Bryobacteraceae bacterium]|nr:hypothetical protein [Bryobacteraceae bacterium]